MLPNSVDSPAAAATTALRKPAGAPPAVGPQDRLNCSPLALPTRVASVSCEAEKAEIWLTERLLPWLASSEAVCAAESFCRLCVESPLTVEALRPPICEADSAETSLCEKALNCAAVNCEIPAPTPCTCAPARLETLSAVRLARLRPLSCFCVNAWVCVFERLLIWTVERPLSAAVVSEPIWPLENPASADVVKPETAEAESAPTCAADSTLTTPAERPPVCVEVNRPI